jgi:cation transport ATPase
LATPLAAWAALGAAATRQVLIRNGEALERLAGIRAIRFDKTGTLTTGTPSVAAFVCDETNARVEILGRAVKLAASSTHVFSAAIAAFAEGASGSVPADDVRTLAGRGMRGLDPASGSPVYLGSLRLMQENAQELGPGFGRAVRAALDRGQSISLVGWDGRVRGMFEFDEQLRPSVVPAIDSVRAAGYDIAVLTGDHFVRGAALAARLGVPVESDLLPAAKVDRLERVRELVGPVAMVGDGVNDAPALAASDVGIALGCGTDVSRDSAQVCLMGNDLSTLPWCFELAAATVRVIRQNLAWSFGYNVGGLLCAALGWLSPALAALLMVASSALVIGNSLRLARMAASPPQSETEPLRGADSASWVTQDPKPALLDVS